MAAMNTANMAEGAKERASQDLASQYSAVAEQSRANLAETQANLTSQYSNLYSKWEENLKTAAQDYASKEETLWDMADSLNYTEYTADDIKNNKATWYTKYYDANGITQEGKDILERVVYGNTYYDPNANKGKGGDVTRTFTGDITENYPELKEWFMEHMGDVNEMMLGKQRDYNPGLSYSWENRESMTKRATEAEQQAKEAGFKLTKDFKNQTEKAQYYETYNAASALMNKIKEYSDFEKVYQQARKTQGGAEFRKTYEHKKALEKEVANELRKLSQQPSQNFTNINKDVFETVLKDHGITLKDLMFKFTGK